MKGLRANKICQGIEKYPKSQKSRCIENRVDVIVEWLERDNPDSKTQNVAIVHSKF